MSLSTTLVLGVPNLLVGNVFHAKNEVCLLEVLIIRLFIQTLSIYAIVNKYRSCKVIRKDVSPLGGTTFNKTENKYFTTDAIKRRLRKCLVYYFITIIKAT